MTRRCPGALVRPPGRLRNPPVALVAPPGPLLNAPAALARTPGRLRNAVIMALALLVAACGTAGSDEGPAGLEPRDGRSGLSITGTVDGRQLAVSDGAPRLNTGDCDVNTGPDTDVCFFSRDIDGRFLAIVIENPAVLAAGESVAVADPGCADACDAVRDAAVVDVQLSQTDPRIRARGGRLAVDTVEPGRRYSGTLTLELPDGRLAGTFEVVPRPEPED